MAASGDARHDWTVFKALNPGLLRSSPGLVRAFYLDERLMSAEARGLFLLADGACANPAAEETANDHN